MENYEKQAQKMQEWMAQNGIEAHVVHLPSGQVALIPGPERDRTAQKKWDKQNMITVSCRVPVPVAEEFREACGHVGKTPYAVIREFVEVIVKEERRVTAARGARPRARPGGPPRSSARLCGVGGDRQDSTTAGTPRGRSPRAPWSVPSAQGRRQLYDWSKEGA